MATKSKIKIVDNDSIRQEIDTLYEQMDHVDVAKWALLVAKHILEVVGIDYTVIDEIADGFTIHELWQVKKARVHDARMASIAIHHLAKNCDDEIQKLAFRVAGHAVASAHMAEHSMVASDYAIKTIDLYTSNDIEAITRERTWQRNEIERIWAKG